MKPTRVDVKSRSQEDVSKRVVKVVVGEGFSVIITNKGDLYSSGVNTFGEMGDKNLDKSNVQQFTLNKMLFEHNIKVTKLATGSNHIVVLDTQHNLWVWGLNLKGQLGLGDYTSRNEPTLLKALSKKYEHEEGSFLMQKDECVS
mmetsp:Transcript_106540/g.229428  ORF Transcript_106540/g.229428 Transcript_106540/m.229428 type:complete len:144 (+) Transcript_106540:101-532(+)